MKIKLYQVDAFTNKVFKGNPAAVCPLNKWIDDSLLQNIAFENNLADTAFYVKTNNGYEIRWFTPKVEVELCGHATLAAAHVLFKHENYLGDEVSFSSKSGNLSVQKKGKWLAMNFPVDEITQVKVPSVIKNCFTNKNIAKVLKGKTDYIVVFGEEEDIKNEQPNFNELLKLNCRGVVITSKAKNIDFVSRFFAPRTGINEDPVTGSAHTSLVPYWSEVLGKKKLQAKQLSERGGELNCELMGDRVLINGQAKTFLIGEIEV